MISVLSGDLVQSGAFNAEEKWLNALKDTLTDIEADYPLLGSGAQIFRGDGFQLATDKPELALEIAILIRAGLKKTDLKLDARLAIGLGESNTLRENILESDGEAFRLSGHLLDQLKKEKLRLALDSPFKGLNEEFKVSLRLAGLVLDNWTQADAETAWLSWKEKMTSKEIQQQLKISQPAVSKRKSGAKLDEIWLLIERYKTQINRL